MGCGTHRKLARGRDKQSRDVKNQPIALRLLLTEKSGKRKRLNTAAASSSPLHIPVLLFDFKKQKTKQHRQTTKTKSIDSLYTKYYSVIHFFIFVQQIKLCGCRGKKRKTTEILKERNGHLRLPEGT